jgi:hypothetical protein
VDRVALVADRQEPRQARRLAIDRQLAIVEDLARGAFDPAQGTRDVPGQRLAYIDGESGLHAMLLASIRRL